MNKLTQHIPNLITSFNLISGFFAVLFAVDGHLIWAGIFICLAAIFDFFDGLAARLLKSVTAIGKQLDSLADLVSFGVAPATILFTLLEFSLFKKNQLIYDISASWDQWLILFSVVLMPVLGAVRLARFNTLHDHKTFFKGLPIPANGLFWASMGLMLEMPRHQELFNLLYSTRNLLLLGLLTSGMMVINMPMFSLKLKNFNLRENWYRYLFVFITLILIASLNIYGLGPIIITYILLNILFYLIGLKY